MSWCCGNHTCPSPISPAVLRLHGHDSLTGCCALLTVQLPCLPPGCLPASELHPLACSWWTQVQATGPWEGTAGDWTSGWQHIFLVITLLYFRRKCMFRHARHLYRHMINTVRGMGWAIVCLHNWLMQAYCVPQQLNSAKRSQAESCVLSPSHFHTWKFDNKVFMIIPW